MRHDNVRDVEAEFLDEVCRGVETEPGLLPVEPENFEKGAITGDMARLDIVATGLFGNMEKTYFDVRVTHPKGLPTLRLEAWASWRGPHGVVCLVVTPDGVDGPTI